MFQRFDRNGNYLIRWGSSGNNNGQFGYADGVAVDSSGNVFVADKGNVYGADGAGGNSQIQKFAPAVPPIPLAAKFTSNVTSGYAPLSVRFNDISTGAPNAWKWDFGDGVTSTLQNPKHTYSKPGKHTVSLKVTNAAGSNTTTKSNYIVVNVPIVANFSASPLSGKKPLTVKFTDKSTGSPTSWLWSFGDKTNSTAQSPIHKYTKAGKYTVSLTVKNSVGSNTKMISNYFTLKYDSGFNKKSK